MSFNCILAQGCIQEISLNFITLTSRVWMSVTSISTKLFNSFQHSLQLARNRLCFYLNFNSSHPSSPAAPTRPVLFQLQPSVVYKNNLNEFTQCMAITELYWWNTFEKLYIAYSNQQEQKYPLSAHLAIEQIQSMPSVRSTFSLNFGRPTFGLVLKMTYDLAGSTKPSRCYCTVSFTKMSY